MDSLVEIIADYIRNNYTFIDSDGKEYKPEGYYQAHNFIQEVIFPQVDDFIKERYEIKED